MTGQLAIQLSCLDPLNLPLDTAPFSISFDTILLNIGPLDMLLDMPFDAGSGSQHWSTQHFLVTATEMHVLVTFRSQEWLHKDLDVARAFARNDRLFRMH